jgi:hypothetical protein
MYFFSLEIITDFAAPGSSNSRAVKEKYEANCRKFRSCPVQNPRLRSKNNRKEDVHHLVVQPINSDAMIRSVAQSLRKRSGILRHAIRRRHSIRYGHFGLSSLVQL